MDPQFTLPDQACAWINSKANELLLQLAPAKGLDTPRRPQMSSSHSVTHALTDEDVIDWGSSGTIDSFGKRLSNFFHTDKGWIGLNEGTYLLADQLSEKIASRSEFREHVSRQFVMDALFDWFKGRYIGTTLENESFVDHFLEATRKGVRTHHIAIPIAYLAIQKPFQIGRVRLDFYGADYFDRFEQVIRQKKVDSPKNPLEKLRNDYQGVVFGHVELMAENERAQSLAAELVDHVVAVLQLYSPTVLFPHARTHFGRMGHATVPIDHYFVFTSDSEWPNLHQNAHLGGTPLFDITDELISLMRADGLDEFSQLLQQKEFTDLEERLLDSILQFAKGIRASDLYDRLTFIFAAIESLLLRSNTEPIQKTIGQRLAFMLFPDAPRRQAVAKAINDAYSVRSAYIHHGKREEAERTLSGVAPLIASAIKSAAHNRRKFSSRGDLIDALERLIFS